MTLIFPRIIACLLLGGSWLQISSAFSRLEAFISSRHHLITSATTTILSASLLSSNSYQPLFTQVISDVDDTLKSSGGIQVAGVPLGGIDVQYERGEFYPGVAEFMLELSRHGLTGEDAMSPAKIAILTARAEEFKAALEIKEGSKLAKALRNAGEAAGIRGWGVGPVLYGSVAEWIIQDRKGLRKFTNFERLLQQDPTGTIFQYIYVGDVGELDQEAGETMLREYPEVVKGVFLHVISDQEGDEPALPAPKFINGRPLVFFRTYIGAAVDAVQLGFMEVDALQSVIDAATNVLAKEPKTSDKWRDLKKDINRAELLTGRIRNSRKINEG
jgi:hypothetical protein